VRLDACGSLNAGMRITSARCTAPGDDCTFREQRQTALSCAAGTVLAAQQDTARSLGVVLNFGVNQRYFLLGVSERRVFLDVSQTVTPFDSSTGVPTNQPKV